MSFKLKWFVRNIKVNSNLYNFFSPVNDYETNEVEKEKTSKNSGHNSVKSQSNGSATGKWNNVRENKDTNSTNNRERKGRQAKVLNDTINEQQKQQDEYCQR